MKLYFVTCNQNKVKEFQSILKNHEVEQVAIDYPELRSDDPEEIAKLAAKQLADILNKPIVVEDSGLFINSLNDFPGTCSAYIHKRIGLKGILKLMKGVKDRSCQYRSAVAYCEPNKEPFSFLGTEKGIIAQKPRGKYGFGHDPIFIPEKSRKTYGEMEDVKEKKRFRRKAVLKLMKFLKQ
ncbi:MAG: XTP/dITP diphosphatase [Nanoarchaeota archaeon]